MRRSTLRLALIWVGFIAVPAILVSSLMVIFGPYIGYTESISALGSLPFIQFMVVISGAPAIAAIAFWAAHNLEPLQFLSNIRVRGLITFSIWANVVSCIFVALNVPVEFSSYGSTTGAGISAVGYMFSTFVYSISSILLLVFARKQMLAKSAGETLKEPSLAETFE